MRRSLGHTVAGLFVVVVGCAGPSKHPDSTPPDASLGASIDGGAVDGSIDLPGHTAGMPGLGAHSLQFQRYHEMNQPVTVLDSAAMTTQPAGSLIVVGIGRGQLALFDQPSSIPTDNKGNSPYLQIGKTRKYTDWNSGTALYAFAAARGGSDHLIAAQTPIDDEITLAAVEVIEGTHVQDYQWNQDAADPIASLQVTTTAPATLISFWWGGGFPDTTTQTAEPDSGFARIDSNADTLGGFVQCAVAVKNVTKPGSYGVNWTSTPQQSAQVWLIAVQ